MIQNGARILALGGGSGRFLLGRSVGRALFIKSKINCIQFQRLASQPWPGLTVHFHFEAYESFYFVLRLSIESESKVLRNRQTMHRISTISDQRHKRRLCPFVAGCNKYSSLCKTSSSGLSAPGKTRLDRERAKMCIAEIVSGIKKDSSQLPWRSERFVSLKPTVSVRGGHPKMTSVKFSIFETLTLPSHNLVLI